MIYLIGASGHAKVIIEILEKRGLVIEGLVDANPDIQSLFDYEVWTEFPTLFNVDQDQVLIAIGDNRIRKEIASNKPYRYVSAIDPSATVSSRSSIGIGSVVMTGAMINSDVRIGNHAIVNTNASIDHDCVIEDFVHISPHVGLAGQVLVGEGTHIGIGACVIPGIRIGKWCSIGAGAVIIRDVPDGCTVVGNPGRIIKEVAFPEA